MYFLTTLIDQLRYSYVSFNSCPDHPPGTSPGICTEKNPGPRAFDCQFFPGPGAILGARELHYSGFSFRFNPIAASVVQESGIQEVGGIV